MVFVFWNEEVADNVIDFPYKSRIMNNLKNNRTSEIRRMLPFFVEFVKFSTGFAVIIAAALLTLHAANAAMP